MKTTSQTKQTKLVPGYEPIPGYVIEKRLGEGGSGEVWLAQAPHGVRRAIKFIHAKIDEKHWQRELESLRRIQSVNHPLLLAVERFDLVDGRLMIVTEVAEGSLGDLFKGYRELGASGVPRDRLIAYLSDAAEVLDHLNEQFQLQHLDVKPANLLIVEGRVKLADFGLLSDLGDKETKISGLTPVYAAPEVFDGSPSQASDQYSLAIVFQELLTGIRPFEGQTVAQFATQHIHAAPNLECLSVADQRVIARALDKNPQRRFARCGEFIDALRKSDNHHFPKSDKPVFRSGVGCTPNEERSALDLKGSMIHASAVANHTDRKMQGRDLPQLGDKVVNAALESAPSQAVVIGIGGLGADLLECIYRRTSAKYLSEDPQITGLLIDTDLESVSRIEKLNSTDQRPGIHTVGVPLKRPHEYQLDAEGKYGSVSPRWIDNIPLSRRTEGLRPLGRLAMVDHAERLQEALRLILCGMIKANGERSLKLYVAASLGGGTGSGMVWDLCFMSRHLLDELGMHEARVIPIVMAPQSKDEGVSPLQCMDAHAALTELNYFLNSENGYPGDRGIGWAPVAAERSPLKETYLFLASTSERPNSLVEKMTEYIFMGTEKVGAILDVASEMIDSSFCRENSGESSVRSVGLGTFEIPEWPSSERLAAASVVRILRRCYGRLSEARQIGGIVSEDWMKSLDINADALLEDAWFPLPKAELERWALLYEAVRQEIGQASDLEFLDTLFQRIAKPLAEADEDKEAYIHKIYARLNEEISTRLLDGSGDLTSFVEALQQVIESIQSVSEMHQVAGLRRAGEASEVARIIRLGAKSHRHEELLGSVHEPGPVLRYLELKLTIERDNRLVGRLKGLISRLKSMKKMLKERATKLESAIKHAHSYFVKTNDGQADPWRALGPGATEVREATETAAIRDCLQNLLNIQAVDTSLHITGQQVSERLQSAWAPIIQEKIDSVLTENDLDMGKAEDGELQFASLNSLWRDFGGYQRRLLIVSSEWQRAFLMRQLSDPIRNLYTVVVIDGSRPAIVHEARHIPLSTVLEHLAVANRDRLSSGGLVARTDVDFSIDKIED